MHDLFYISLSFAISLVIAIKSIPTIINVAHAKHLFDEPNSRSATEHVVPTLGGIAIFFGFVLSVIIGGNGYAMPWLKYIIAAVTIMFFVGLKDDILSLSPVKKLIAQIGSACMLIFLADFRFTHLHGLFGINELNYFSSIIGTLFIMIVFINAFNLIDGIDGLASGISILASTVFGVWFFFAGHTEETILAFSLSGALCGFFYYNVYGKKNKIFMGDTGSLILGTIMSVLVIKFNEVNIDQTHALAVASAPAVSFGILIYPLFDTMRVFSMRLYQKRSPFSPDKNHIHHRLLALGLTHKKATFTILILNAIFIISVFALQNIGIMALMAFNISAISLFVLVLALVISSKELIKKDDPHQQILIPMKSEKLLNSALNKEKTGYEYLWAKSVRFVVHQLERINLW
jgi:UDP-N-acetylmuramyl pentapeptide phosphotransferase/UDP-N-acetylglucosamine-1-phosphate transferase